VTAISDFPLAVAVGDILAMGIGIAMIYAASNEMNAAFKRGYDAASEDHSKEHYAPDHPMLKFQGPLYDFRIVRRLWPK
jgi:hypothetical protein